ncbi:hypothetical protein F9K33_16380 [bacterium]|nr:MAG: hypothetical protein F9K33_16380 [bacterium]
MSTMKNKREFRMIQFTQWLALAVVLTAATSCGSNLTDSRDGKVYKTIRIGDQVWMAENLNFDAGEGSYCYNGDSLNCEKHGRLYTWDAAVKAAPAGWHVPSKEEWEILISSFGGIDSIAYSQMIQGGGSGFNALPGIGSRDQSGNYLDVGKGAYFWSSTEDGDKDAWFCVVSKIRQKVHVVSRNKKDAFPVRCLKD